MRISQFQSEDPNPRIEASLDLKTPFESLSSCHMNRACLSDVYSCRVRFVLNACHKELVIFSPLIIIKEIET